MSGPLLRTGTLTDYHPVGAVGHPVYLAAAQLRAALARRLGPDLADSFAIPQRNEDGDTLDWYAPRPGPVVPWSSASAQERIEAQRQLLDNRARIDELAQTMLADPNPERQVFARLLAHVLSFPDQEHIYLVDGRPVVSFWGFVRDRDAVGSDPLVDLVRLAADPLSPSSGLGPAAGAEPPSEAPRRGWPWWLWLALLLIAAALALLFFLRGCAPISTLGSAPEPVDGEPAGVESPIEPWGNVVDNSSDEQVAPWRPVDAAGVAEGTWIDRDQGVDRVTGSSGGSLAVDSDRTVISDTDWSSSHRSDSSSSSALSRESDTRLDSSVLIDDVIGSGSADAPMQPGLDAVPEGGLDEAEMGPVEGDIPSAEDGVPDAEAMGAQPLEEGETPMTDSGADVDADVGAGLSDPAIEPSPELSPDSSLVEPGASGPDDVVDATGAPEALEPVGESPADAVIPAATGTEGPGVASSVETDAQNSEPGGGALQPAGSSDPAGQAEADRGAVPDSPVGQPMGTPQDPSGPPRSAAQGGAASAGARPAMKDLSSGWQTATSLQDPKTGLPIQMEYRTQDGAGQLRLKRHDGSICQTSAAASVEEDRLVIDSSGDIRCADGTNFGRPRVECTPGKDGKPSCVGRNPDGTTFSFDVQGAADP